MRARRTGRSGRGGSPRSSICARPGSWRAIRPRANRRSRFVLPDSPSPRTRKCGSPAGEVEVARAPAPARPRRSARPGPARRRGRAGRSPARCSGSTGTGGAGGPVPALGRLAQLVAVGHARSGSAAWPSVSPRPGTSVGSVSATRRPSSDSIGSFRRSSSRLPTLSRRLRAHLGPAARRDHQVHAEVQALDGDLLEVAVEPLEVAAQHGPAVHDQEHVGQVLLRRARRSARRARASAIELRPSSRNAASRSCQQRLQVAHRLAHLARGRPWPPRRSRAAGRASADRPPPPRSMA